MSLEIYSNPEARLDRKERISDNLKEFKKNVDSRFENQEDKDKVLQALDLMLEAHLSQKDRADGKPYVSHPLEVARKTIDTVDEPSADLVIASLLHDSVEDKSEVLFAKRVNKKYPDKDFMFTVTDELKEKHKEIFKRFSFRELKDIFGEKLEYYVHNLTNHDFDSLIEDTKPNATKEEKEMLKNDLYKEHIEEIIQDPDLCLLKYADFSVNIDLRSLDKKSAKYKKLRRKYKSVIPIFIQQLENVDESHLLYKKKNKLIGDLKEIYKNQYSD
jgi:(p)ppGpp synthase/HD superfamily hydrolase